MCCHCTYLQVDQELCNRHNQLTNVLSTISFFQLQTLTVKVEAASASAAAAYQEDVARFEQNLVSIAGGMQQLINHLQEHKQELQGLWPQLQAMGVQLAQSNQLIVDKVDEVAGAVEEVDRKLQELLLYYQQQRADQQLAVEQPEQQGKVLLPKPDMLIPQDFIKSLGGFLGEGGYGVVVTARYGAEDVALKGFFLDGANAEEMKKVSAL